jgi:hypothetical protein
MPRPLSGRSAARSALARSGALKTRDRLSRRKRQGVYARLPETIQLPPHLEAAVQPISNSISKFIAGASNLTKSHQM